MAFQANGTGFESHSEHQLSQMQVHPTDESQIGRNARQTGFHC
nr:hypothetical protein [Vibrio viridaestus]